MAVLPFLLRHLVSVPGPETDEVGRLERFSGGQFAQQSIAVGALRLPC